MLNITATSQFLESGKFQSYIQAFSAAVHLSARVQKQSILYLWRPLVHWKDQALFQNSH